MFTKAIFSGLLATGFTAAHMQMSWPYPLRSQFDPNNAWNQIDYSMTSPLNQDGMFFTPPHCHENTLNNYSRLQLPL